MRAPLSNIPKRDRAAVWSGFSVLFAVVAAHALLETARDTLFLRDLPASNLPWAYLGIAGLCIVAASAHRRLRAFNSGSRMLVLTLLAGAAITAGLWLATAEATRASLFALYVWTGVLSSVVVVQIWLRLGVVLDIVSAKTGFAFVGAGGMAGAALGSWLADVILRALPARALLIAAAAALGIAAIIAATLSGEAHDDGEDVAPAGEVLTTVRSDPYLMRLLAIAALAPLPLMLTDYLFKSVATAGIARDDLGAFFARFYAVTNTVALGVQIFLVPRLLARLGAVAASAIFPASLGILGGAAAAVGGLPLIVAMKAGDATLRHSLNRAGNEILFLPIQARHRPTAKFLAEAVGQRGGQAVASLLLLGALAAGIGERALLAAVAILAVAWLATLLRLRSHYVARFRAKLGTLRSADRGYAVPDLELDSLETLVQALSSPQDEDVVAALDVLHAYGKAHLIPGLILYHPSSEVVLRALDIFAREPRTARQDLSGLVERLLDREDARVRAAALRGVLEQIPDARLERLIRGDASSLVRATAIVGQLARIEVGDQRLLARVDELIDTADLETKCEVARAVSSLPEAIGAPIIARLIEDQDRVLRVALAESIAADPRIGHLPVLLELLTTRDARFPARQALVAIGDPALEYLAEQSQRAELDEAIRRHIPRTISRFGTAAAAKILIGQLERDPDTAVRYKILRGLGRMRANQPDLPIDPRPLADEARRSLERAIELLSYSVALERVGGSLSAADSRVAALLPPLLEEKEKAAIERIFRVLRILNPEERFDAVFNGLRVADRQMRAGSIEMLGHVVDDDLRPGLLAIVSFGDAAERLTDARVYYEPPLAASALAVAADSPDRESALGLARRLRAELTGDPDPVLRSVAEIALATVSA